MDRDLNLTYKGFWQHGLFTLDWIKGATMQRKEFEVRMMNYFAENINL
jgi:hypothetical protein